MASSSGYLGLFCLEPFSNFSKEVLTLSTLGPGLQGRGAGAVLSAVSQVFCSRAIELVVPGQLLSEVAEEERMS